MDVYVRVRFPDLGSDDDDDHDELRAQVEECGGRLGEAAFMSKPIQMTAVFPSRDQAEVFVERTNGDGRFHAAVRNSARG